MANNFLKVEKDLLNKGLSPIEILVYSQIMEFNRNTGDCFMSDAAMAKAFGVSDKTISRTMTSLEQKGLIVRNTKMSQKGKERHIVALATDNLPLANEIKESATDKLSLPEQTNCPLRKGQNDSIKDNIKDKERDNRGVDNSVSLRSTELSTPEMAPVVIEGIEAKRMTRKEATDIYGLTAAANNIPTAIKDVVWISGNLIQLIREE